MPDTTNLLPGKPSPSEQPSPPRSKHLGMLRPDDVALYIAGVMDPLILPVVQEVTLGRVSPTSQTQPHVDLTPYSALEKGVSRMHAVIRRTKDGLMVQDLGSINGTWLNDIRMRLAGFYPLSSGSALKLGRLEIEIYFNSTSNSLPTEQATQEGPLLPLLPEAEKPSVNSSAPRLAAAIDGVVLTAQPANVGRSEAGAVLDPLVVRSSPDSSQTDIVGLDPESRDNPPDVKPQGLLTKQQATNPGIEAPLSTSPHVALPITSAQAHVTHYQGTVSLDPLAVFSQMGTIADELIRYLNSLSGCQVELLLEIRADCLAGFDEPTIQTMRQLNDKLKFRSLEFKSGSTTP